VAGRPEAATKSPPPTCHFASRTPHLYAHGASQISRSASWCSRTRFLPGPDMSVS
jgi:hypothetical protein